MSIILSKSFSPTTIVDGGITTLSFTVIINEMFPQPVIQIFDTLPSGLAYGGSFNVPPGWVVFQIPPVGTNGIIQADGISLPNGTYTLTFSITNFLGQTNPSCEFNPPSFTNQSSNLVLNPPIFMFDGIPSCLVVSSIPPIPPNRENKRNLPSIPPTICVDKMYDKKSGKEIPCEKVSHRGMIYVKVSDNGDKCCYILTNNRNY